ncbi:MAG TPA: hypothetical protein VFX18_05675 [Candidatus Nitrosocosmicus sp.]|nr:hypothetical protein [Candidatus Nitrosocosmicus sp.]
MVLHKSQQDSFFEIQETFMALRLCYGLSNPLSVIIDFNWDQTCCLFPSNNRFLLADLILFSYMDLHRLIYLEEAN